MTKLLYLEASPRKEHSYSSRVASAFLDAWWMLGRADCKNRAERILSQLWDTLRAPGGGMYHYSDGAPCVPGLLMDSVRMGLALLDAYGVCGNAFPRVISDIGGCGAADEKQR